MRLQELGLDAGFRCKKCQDCETCRLRAGFKQMLLLENLGMVVKGWTVAGNKPPDDVTRDGKTVVFAGHVWYSEMNVFKLNIPPSTSGKRSEESYQIQSRCMT